MQPNRSLSFAAATSCPPRTASPVCAAMEMGSAVAAWHASRVRAAIDLGRSMYGAAVQAGVVERSMLASAAVGRALHRLEHQALGPWARTV